jgi:hypothetical protein
MKDKQNEQQRYIDDYNKSIDKAFILLNALEDYDKNTINKTFFEKYFARKYKEGDYIPKENKVGDIIRDWKGNITTDYNLQNATDTWNKYSHRVYLYDQNQVEVDNRDRQHMIERTKETIQNLKDWRDSAIVKRDFYRDFDLKAFKQDIKSLLEKYGATEYWYYINNQINFLD